MAANVTRMLGGASAGGSAYTTAQAVPIKVHGGHAQLRMGHTGGVDEAIGVACAGGQLLVAEPCKLCVLLGRDAA